jgi:type 1 glutamine amidotransferase
MKTLFLSLITVGLFLTAFSCASKSSTIPDKEQSQILVFSKTEGFRHDAIPEGINAIKNLGEQEGFSVTATEDAAYFAEDSLQNYRAIIFLNTTGNVLNDEQQEALRAFLTKGGGFMGVHAATDTEYEWPWYGRMIGAYFNSHPKIQEAELQVLDKTHPSTTFLPDSWTRTDEWYNFRDIQDHINPLIMLDETSYKGGENGENHPMAWYHEFEGGRVFYTGGGHTKRSYSDSLFIKHLMGGIEYASGGGMGSSEYE